MNYYEHETKVKIIENILNRSKDWDWFITYTQEQFEADFTINSFQDAIDAFKDVHEVFEFLCRIREITNEEFCFSKDWLKDLDELAFFFSGKKELDNINLTFNLSKIYLVLILSGKIYSQIINDRVYFYDEIFRLRNLSSLIDLNLFVDEENKILSLLNEIEIDVSRERQIFEDNINGIFYPADDKFIERHTNKLLFANCFSFTQEKDDQLMVWEEQELLNMLKISFENDTIIPLYSNGTYHIPEYRKWTVDILEHIAAYFNAECVNFITESLKFAIHNVVPTAATINKHFELLYELAKTATEDSVASLSCSSLEFIISFFNDENCSKLINKDAHIKFDFVLNRLSILNGDWLLFEIKDRKALHNKKINDELNIIVKNRLNDIGGISDFRSFTSFINDKKIFRAMNNVYFQKISHKFADIIPHADIILAPTVFWEYFIFLMRIKNNRDIDSHAVGSEIVRIRALWKREYYDKCKKAMTVIKSGPITVPKGIENMYVYSILNKPMSFAASCLKLTDNGIVDCMIQISDTPMLMLASRIIIAEDFPQKPFLKMDGKHPIDEFYLKEIEKQLQNNGYKLRNSFKSVEFARSIYDRIKDELRMRLTFLKNIKPLYEIVIQQNSEYKFIDLCEEVSLAHLTQLFPILENRIRSFGELFGIVPVCESEDMCHRLKEPDSILKNIISQIYKMDDSLTLVADMFFIHFCMYGENGLNIRNDCIHGNGYFTKEQILFAFKITLICLYMVGARYEIITQNFSKTQNDSSQQKPYKKEDTRNTFGARLKERITQIFRIRKD